MVHTGHAVHMVLNRTRRGFDSTDNQRRLGQCRKRQEDAKSETAGWQLKSAPLGVWICNLRKIVTRAHVLIRHLPFLSSSHLIFRTISLSRMVRRMSSSKRLAKNSELESCTEHLIPRSKLRYLMLRVTKERTTVSRSSMSEIFADMLSAEYEKVWCCI
ncbi:hypothetical protein EV356DRAFT_72032 [Viridothelium virens]|uniref:Uncharacterized protein n=1 Tax=Viridothelium virens TaxID=1048519 RepID=A0A6A6HFZ5_VIRVR|nr:hypothetical protein EV356DRAFT_72032 [Viridothelium virens]